MAGKVSAEEYAKVKEAVAKNYTADSVKNYTSAYNQAKSSWASSKDAFSSASGLLVKNSTSWGSSNTNAWWDVYGDVSGKRSAWLQAKDYSNYQETALSPDLNKYGASAREMEKNKAGSISQRNDIIAWNLLKQWIKEREDIRKYLNTQAWFTDAEDWEQNNTIDAIKARMWEMEKQWWGTSEDEVVWGEDISVAWKKWEFEDRAGYWYDENGNYYKIHWYDELDDFYKNAMDREDNATRKRLSNEWDADMQDKVKAVLDTRRTEDQAKERFDISKEIYDINRESSIIQAEQNIRNAEESYNNLKQNWQYLGNLGMPGVSATKIQAIGDAITEAKTTLGEVKRLTQLSLDAQEKQWEGQVLQYNQQIDNLMYDLKWKVWDEITNALSKYTTAELEGKLDTIDGITAFRKELLDDLDNNLSGLTSASLSQMQWINQQYQDIANKMYEYSQNANTVNTQMSQVKGFYVDGNGNAILNNQGQPIQVPQSAPMDPIFDKETGKLITFGMDENWQIVASVQQVYQGDATATQSTIVSLLENGVSVQDILKYVPGVDLKTVQALAEIVKPIGGWYASYEWQGKNYTPVSQEKLVEVYNSFWKQFYNEDGTIKDIKGGQCGKFVNDYLEKLGVGRLFTDPITEKKQYVNSDTPKIGSIAIMDSESKPEYGHVWIVVGVEWDKVKILQSNKKGEEKVFYSEKNAWDIYGYFDPTKSIDEYNEEVKRMVDGKIGDYDEAKVSLYKNYLEWNYTNMGDLIKDREFQQEAYNYGRQQGSAAALDALGIMMKMGWVSSGMKWSGLLGKAWGVYEWNKLYNQLEKKLTLNELTDLKTRSWASLWAMSEWEWKILWDAATNLSKWWVATWMQDRAWRDEMRALTLAAYPMEADQNNWEDVLVKHQKELMWEYYTGNGWAVSWARQEVSWGNLWW